MGNANASHLAIIQLQDGETVKAKQEVTYLGCELNNKADGRREVCKRLTICMTILKRLDLL